jgi:flagellar protein FlaJ
LKSSRLRRAFTKLSWFKRRAKTPTRTSAPASREVALGEFLSILALALFERVSRGLVKALEFDIILSRAGLSIHPVKYVANVLMITTLTVVSSVACFLGLVFTGALKTTLELVVGVLVVVVLNVFVFATTLIYPYMRSSSRKVETENELPYFLAYLSTLTRGGLSFDRVLSRVAELRVFKAIRLEALRVLTRIKAYGEDPITAVEKVALNHPSSRFRDVILGYTTTLKSGGDVVHYLEVRTREIIESRANEIKAIIGGLTSFLEIYTIFGVIVALALYVFFVVQAATTAAQALRAPGALAVSIDVTAPALYNFLVLPVLGLTIALAIHISQPRTPIGYSEVYLTMLSWLPVPVLVFILVLIATSGVDVLFGKLTLRGVVGFVYATLFSLIALSIPPAVKHRSIVRRYRGIIKATADFLRDLSELRKTGLSPEKCIILTSSRDYRSLTPIVERAGVSLSIGLNLEEALRRALRGCKEWFVIASFRFLADSIIVGGGSPEIIDVLARFTQTLSELEEETRRRMKTQIILPYLGAILLSSMPMILLYMLLALARVPVTVATPLIFVLAMGAVLNSFVMGLIAGKASEATLAAGFLHAILLEVVTGVSLFTAFKLIGVI